MYKTIRFFKINEGINAGWYADVPGHSLEDNQMVAGADDFLEQADGFLGCKGEVTIVVSESFDSASDTPFMAKLLMIDHDEDGASYSFTGPMAEKYDAVGFRMWICNVTHDVLGEHPRCIYIYDIR